MAPTYKAGARTIGHLNAAYDVVGEWASVISAYLVAHALNIYCPRLRLEKF